eukprot:CAMPEP_0179273524 /NCGR_PEP_ID=MMETSP0797-20121207/33056_1 /TAXON_ID=47934 /ORGANISM="Dinophysis acuminata, Strain DAEP01" /LENGTH=453 /DNA_ID=CAMNT_0020981951 /DNA_START=6 /DNA_END=1367 /DNA_ORIENTATION=+
MGLGSDPVTELDTRAPLHCLVPTDVAGALAKLLRSGGEYGAMRVWSSAEAPNLSDRVVAIAGDREQLESGCQVVLSLLRQSQGAENTDGALFVLLVPARAARTVVGARGQRIQKLTQQTGAKISVSRDIIEGLQMQCVTLMGTMAEVLAGTVGIQGVLREHAERPDLPPPGHVADYAHLAPPSDDSQHWPCRAPTPVTLLVDMDAAGWIIGKQGKTLAQLQKSTGACIQVRVHAPDGRGGAKCGDRVVQISGGDAARQDSAIRAVFDVVEEKQRHNADKITRDRDDAISLLIPASAVGRVIGTGGQNINDISQELGVQIRFDHPGPLVAGGKRTIITGPLVARVEAVRLLSNKVDELREAMPAKAPLMAGIQASGVLNNQLTLQVLRDVIDRVDLPELERRTGVTIMVKRAMVDGADSNKCFVTLVGQRLCTSMAILYLQQMLVEAGHIHYIN